MTSEVAGTSHPAITGWILTDSRAVMSSATTYAARGSVLVRGGVALGKPAVSDEVVKDGHLAAVFEFDGEVAAGDLIAPPFIIDPPAIVDGADVLEPSLHDDCGRLAVDTGFDGGGFGLVQEP